jgi:uncharacterized membrane protein YfcA
MIAQTGQSGAWVEYLASIDWADLLPFIAVGFAAQLVDGALGMAFGLINSTLLVSMLGVSPAVASASVHAVETFTTAASGVSHVAHRNVDWKLFPRIAIPGVIGGVLGAYVLSSVDASVAKPFVMAYLAAIGLYLLYRAWRGQVEPRSPRIIEPLGLVGGFLDAAGGGGWGPVVTSNLLIQGASPRMTIGTVNTAEFFISAAVSLTFFVEKGHPDRRARGGPVGRTAGKTRAGAAVDGGGWRVADRHQRLHDLARAALSLPGRGAPATRRDATARPRHPRAPRRLRSAR